jgi:hypothetical protein
LAQALASPWRLFLATAAYQGSQSQPDELLRLPAGTLSEHLLSELIPAMTMCTARGDGTHYSPDDVRTWLTTLAQHLDQTSRRLYWSPTDLHLQRLWPIAGPKIRLLSALINTAIVSVPFFILSLRWVDENGRWYPDSPPQWGGLITGVGLVVGSMVYFASDYDPTLQRLDLRLSSSARRKEFALRLAPSLIVGVVGGLLTGLAAGLALGMPAGLGFGLAGALAFGIPLGLAVWVRYVIGCWLARRRRMLPRRVGQFLDWSYKANLLRMSGTATQFRHRELQNLLVPHPADTSTQIMRGRSDALEPAGPVSVISAESPPLAPLQVPDSEQCRACQPEFPPRSCPRPESAGCISPDGPRRRRRHARCTALSYSRRRATAALALIR